MKWAARLSTACVLSCLLAAQTPDSVPAGSDVVWQIPKEGGFASGYRAPRVAGLDLEDGVRLKSLVRDGKIYLSLRDAISLALENNLDLELERYGIRLADTDVMRSKAGLIPRGVPLTVRESTPGLGTPIAGPNGTLGGGDTPVINSLTGPGVQVDLSILGSSAASHRVRHSEP